MANEKFTQLPSVVNANLADIICAVQGGISSQETLGQIKTLMQANIIQNYAGNPNGNVEGVRYGFCWDTTNLVLYVCTTSGNSTTAVWTVAGSVTFPITMADGGTGKALTAVNGGIVYTDANSMEVLAATATAGQVLRSGSNSAPSWSTATYPATTTINQILYSSAANVVGGITSANSATLVTSSAGVPSFTASMTNGQILIGSTGATPSPATLTAGPGISISNGAASITISGTGSGIGWTEVTGTTQAMSADSGYISNNGGVVTLTLPATAAVGTAISIIGKGAGGWLIAQNGGQNIQVGSSSSTVGAGGSIASTNRYDSINLICTTANTTWTALGAPQGIITIV
jgi:hypothetical protein